MKHLKLHLIIVILLMTCSKMEKPEIENNRNAKGYDESVINTTDTKNTPLDKRVELEFKFKKDQVYGTTNEIIVGNIASFTVDTLNRVFIADRSQTRILVFQQDGIFLFSIGRQGKGPAEFAAISPNTVISINESRLFVPNYANSYNFFPTSIQIFSLNDLKFSQTVSLIAENKYRYKDILDGFFPGWVYPKKDGNFLIAYRRMPNEYKNDKSFIKYFIQNGKAAIISGPVLEQKDLTYLTYDVSNAEIPYTAMQSFSFLGKSLFAMSKEENLYTARTEEFKINVLDATGKHIRTIIHSVDPVKLDRNYLINHYEKQYKSSLGEGVLSAMIKSSDQIPNVWPILNDMLIDDENQLWVSTIVEDFDIYEWWMLEERGELITKFEWPRDKPIKEIRNSAIYTLETDPVTGLQQVVRYGFELVAR